MTVETIIETIMAVAIYLGLSGLGMVGVARCESTLRPAVISLEGYRGLYQLSPAHVRRFYFQGWEDITDVSQQTFYVGNYVIARGSPGRPNWSEWTCGRRYYS